MGSFLSGAGIVTPTNGPALTAPEDLAPQLRPYWKIVVQQLPADTATAHDTQVILQLCQALHVRDRAYQQILDSGIETTDNTHGGEKRRNPAIITWRQAADMATQILNLLGMSPVSRVRIQGRGADDHDSFLEYLRRRDGPTETG